MSSYTTIIEAVPTQNVFTATISIRPEPLEKFSLFLRLPSEVRRMIWQFALPNPERMIPLRISRLASDIEHEVPVPQPSLQFSFTYRPIKINPEPIVSVSSADLALSTVCYESRMEYLRANPKFLPESSGGKIYYNPDTTIIYIRNWYAMDLLRDGRDISNSIKQGLEPQKFFSDIKRFAVFNCTVVNIPFGSSWAFANRGDANIIRLFQNVKEWIGVVHQFPFGEEHSEKEIGHFRCRLKIRRKALEHYKETYDQNYKIPKLSLLEIRPMKRARWFDCP